MCGIAGIIQPRGQHYLAQEEALLRMQQHLAHRGPDDKGVWRSDSGQALLAHTRLSIIDLSPAGHQPMTSPDGRFAITFNGEIYNFRQLRTELEQEGEFFQTESDTEVILLLYQKHGQQAFSRLRGMFALAVWDEKEKTLVLARDPLGIKPLYVHQRAGTLAFASEVRALATAGIFEPTLNPAAVEGYFQTGSVPEPQTLVREVENLPAGTTMVWKDGRSSTSSHWHFPTPGQEGPQGDPVAQTRAALEDSIRHHFVSDVPVGIFLSGGIDSTALVALARAGGHSELTTFSIAVDDPDTDEGGLAQRTASHFGTDHHELRLDAQRVLPRFAEFLNHIDQPTIDGFNTFTVSKLARDHGMKVVLSGLGSDELFGGYHTFHRIPVMQRWHRWTRRIPAASRLLMRGSPQHRRMADFLKTPGSITDAYTSLRGIFARDEAKKLSEWITGNTVQSGNSPSPADSDLGLGSPLCAADQISRLELTRYMRNQLLRDSDVMSMAHGLELRVPFVDRVLVEQLTAIPAPHRIQPGKKLLTDAVPEVPSWIINQPKRGFLFPYQKWLQSEWGDKLNAAVADCPIPTPNWYQRWSVFMLRYSIDTLGL